MKKNQNLAMETLSTFQKSQKTNRDKQKDNENHCKKKRSRLGKKEKQEEVQNSKKDGFTVYGNFLICETKSINNGSKNQQQKNWKQHFGKDTGMVI